MSATQNNNSWYAIQVRPKFERIVSQGLSGKGYEEYLPLYRSQRRWSDRIKELELPLFPHYLFCRFDIESRLPIIMTPGVVSIVGAGKTPIAVSEQEIETVKAVVRSGHLVEPWPNLVVGSTVVIEKGPLKGLEGVAVDIKKKYRLFIAVPILQRSVSVEIDRGWVRPLPVRPALTSRSCFERTSAVGKVA